MNKVSAYKLINWETNELIDIALSFKSLAEMYLGARKPELHIIKAYPRDEVVTFEELKDRIDGSESYIPFTIESANKETIFDMMGWSEQIEHYAIAKIEILG